jgi:WhiB family redox-sensing transcriptional regulator
VSTLTPTRPRSQVDETDVRVGAETGEPDQTRVPSTRGRELPCHTVAPDLWFAESPADVEAAKALCLPCPLRAACLAGALERQEPWGVWGGQLVLAGVVVPRKRPRGRPRKDGLTATSTASAA